jgi:hypothetical protein
MKKGKTNMSQVILKVMLLATVFQMATITQSFAMSGDAEPVVAIRIPADGLGSGPSTQFVPISEAYQSGNTSTEPVVAIRIPADGLGSGPSTQFVPISEAYQSGNTSTEPVVAIRVPADGLGSGPRTIFVPISEAYQSGKTRRYYYPTVQISGGNYKINESTVYNCKEALRGTVTKNQTCIFGSEHAQTAVNYSLRSKNKFLKKTDFDSCLNLHSTSINDYSNALNLSSLNKFFKCTQDKSHAGKMENEKFCRSIPSLNKNGGTIVHGNLQESYTSYGGVQQDFPDTQMLCVVNRRYDSIGDTIISCAREHNIKINRFDQILIRENELSKISACISK